MKKVIIEKFSRNRYEKYTKKGISFRFFDGRGQEWKLKQMDCGYNNEEILFEKTVYVESLDKYVTSSHFFAQNGMTGYKMHQLYIVQGMDGIEDGDLVITKNSADSSFFFYNIFSGITRLDKSIGLGLHWSCDCYGGQINLCHLHHALSGVLKNDIYIRKATDEEEKKFYELLLAGGYAHDEDEGCLYDVPKVGVEYYTVEPTENGLMQVVRHDAPTCEEERTFGKRNVYASKLIADERVKKLNKILIHGKLE